MSACRLAKLLLDKETVNLPQIIEVLGERPFEMKESIKEYLSEIKKREQEQQEADAAEAASPEPPAEDLDAEIARSQDKMDELGDSKKSEPEDKQK